MLASLKFTLTAAESIVSLRHKRSSSFCCRAETTKIRSNGDNKKKVLIVGSGWAGLGAANHLCNQGFDVTVLEDGNGFGSPDNVGIQGFWYPYRNIFSLVDELGIKPFTNWMQSAQYSTTGVEVKFPVFQDLPQLPTPLGTLYHSQFTRLPLVDRLTSLPLMAAVIDFDNTDVAWRKYDPITARELFKQFGCSERLYRDIFGPLVQVGLFAPPQLCSAAATLGIMYYISLAHQRDFDKLMCRGEVKEKIFAPWKDSLSTKGCHFPDSKKVADFFVDEETGCISEVFYGKEMCNVDAVILAVGIHTLQELVRNSAALRANEEFLKVLNLNSIDTLTAKIQLDKKVNLPTAVNACSSFDDSFGWTLFDLNAIYDEHKESLATVLQADFYHANEFLPLKDEDVVKKVKYFLSTYIEDLDGASVTDAEIKRFPNSLNHFFPGSYKYMLRGSTSFPNLFMAGDWIINRHGSWSQEKSYVTGLEAANRVIDLLGEGSFARIIPVEEDEPHVEALRNINRRFNEFREQLPLSDYFLQ